ncbi:discoidin domain-containing protein [Natronospora cellulosivora (SeqCode)]
MASRKKTRFSILISVILFMSIISTMLIFKTIGFPIRASAAKEVEINIDTSKGHAINPNFSGFNVNITAGDYANNWNYDHPELIAGAKNINTGWLRYFAGTVSNAFNWRTGLYEEEWLEKWNGGPYDRMMDSSRVVAGKGPHKLSELNNLMGEIGGELIVVINAFTDTPEAAADLAKFVKDNNIQVSIFQLTNEPYFFVPGSPNHFFDNSIEYANNMRPYAEAIRASYPDAKIALMYGADGRYHSWDRGLRDYPEQFWDVITYHSYAPQSSNDTFDEARLRANRGLAVATSEDRVNYYLEKGLFDKPIMITEYNVFNPAIAFTMYAGIYVTEFAMRMSQYPEVEHLGMHAITPHAFGQEQTYIDEILAAADRGEIYDTSNLELGVEYTPSGLGMKIVNKAFNNSSHVWSTSIEGGESVEILNSRETIPAIYATAYKGHYDKNYLLVTNKSGLEQDLTINKDNIKLKSNMTINYISAIDPEDRSEPTIKSKQTENPVTLPPYSVARIEWDRGEQYIPRESRIYDLEVGDSKVHLKWWERNSATAYTIKYGIKSGVYTEEINLGRETEYTIEDLKKGEKYYFVVTANNDTGSSGYSNEVYAEIRVPDTPEIRAARAKNGQVTVEWQSVPYASGYILKYGREPYSYKKRIDVANVTGYNVSNLQNDTKYYFSVHAYNGLGKSLGSQELVAKPKEGLPFSPSSLYIQLQGDSEVKLNWESSELYPGDTYNVYRSTSPLDGFSLIAEEIKGNTYLDQDLEAGQRYYYYLTALNQKGVSQFHSIIRSVHIRSKYIYEKPQGSKLNHQEWEIVDYSSESVFNGRLAENAIDGAWDTWWHTAWQGEDPVPAHPHYLIIDLGDIYEVDGIGYLPRPDNQNGNLKRFEVYASEYEDVFTDPAIEVNLAFGNNNESVISFAPVNARYIKIKTLESNGPWANIAILDVYGIK